MSSALVYSVQTCARSEPCLERPMTLQTPSARTYNPYFIAILPASASLSWKMGESFVLV